MLIYGLGAIIGLLWAYDEIEKYNASVTADANARSIADSSLYALLGQSSELTNIPAAGALPANSVSMGALH